jgi:cation transport ATPase
LEEQSAVPSPPNRAQSEQARAHKYRFAQSLIFGLPVLALELFGEKLGGAESARWVMLFQALLAAWVMFVGAVPMIMENILAKAERRNQDIKLSSSASGLWAVAIYFVGIFSWVLVLRGGRRIPYTFAISVAIVIISSGVQWLRLSRQPRP